MDARSYEGGDSSMYACRSFVDDASAIPTSTKSRLSVGRGIGRLWSEMDEI